MRLKMSTLACGLALLIGGCGTITIDGPGFKRKINSTDGTEEPAVIAKETAATTAEPGVTAKDTASSSTNVVAKDPAVNPPTAAVQLVNVKPEIDYSGESPDCFTAAQRLADNVQVGMTLGEVTRLVGQPKWRITGSWRWSKTFGGAGKPLVRFPFQQGRAHMVITKVVSDSSNCEPIES